MGAQFSTVDAKVLKGDKLGLGGTTPATQATHIADVTGGATVDANARTTIAAILDVLDRFGLTAAS